MEDNYIKAKIKELNGWYQRIDLGGNFTTHKNKSSKAIWSNIISLTGNISGKRVLDLGCNAGLFSILSAIDGAEEVISIEKGKRQFKQALFVKEYFDDFYKKEFPITYINSDVAFLDVPSIGKFDVVLALSILYHVGQSQNKNANEILKLQKTVIGKLCKITNCIIVRARKKERKLRNQKYFDPIFLSFGFKNIKTLDHRNRVLIKYEKQ